MVTGYESCSCKERQCSGCGQSIAALVSILGGILFAVAGVLLFNLSLLPDIAYVVWVVLIAALVYLFTLIAISVSGNADGKAKCCLKKYIAILLIGVFGAIFSSLIALAAGLTVGSTISLILAAMVFFFFAYMVISSLFLISDSV